MTIRKFLMLQGGIH